MNAPGLRARLAIVSLKSRVPLTRLSTMRCFFSSVHRPLAIPSPDKLITASKPASAGASIDPRFGCHSISPDLAAARTRGVTSVPAAFSVDLNAEPTRPLAPAIKTLMLLSPKSAFNSVRSEMFIAQPIKAQPAPFGGAELYMTGKSLVEFRSSERSQTDFLLLGL